MTINKLMDTTNMQLSKKELHIWEQYVNSPLILNNIKTVTIESVVARQYLGDFYGLLHNILQIPNEACYIHLRVNGLTSSINYDGFTTIKIVSPDVIENILNLIKEELSHLEG